MTIVVDVSSVEEYLSEGRNVAVRKHDRINRWKLGSGQSTSWAINEETSVPVQYFLLSDWKRKTCNLLARIDLHLVWERISFIFFSLSLLLLWPMFFLYSVCFRVSFLFERTLWPCLNTGTSSRLWSRLWYPCRLKMVRSLRSTDHRSGCLPKISRHLVTLRITLSLILLRLFGNKQYRIASIITF